MRAVRECVAKRAGRRSAVRAAPLRCGRPWLRPCVAQRGAALCLAATATSVCGSCSANRHARTPAQRRVSERRWLAADIPGNGGGAQAAKARGASARRHHASLRWGRASHACAHDEPHLDADDTGIRFVFFSRHGARKSKAFGDQIGIDTDCARSRPRPPRAPRVSPAAIGRERVGVAARRTGRGGCPGAGAQQAAQRRVLHPPAPPPSGRCAHLHGPERLRMLVCVHARASVRRCLFSCRCSQTARRSRSRR